MITVVRMAQKSGWFKNGVVGLSESARLELLNGTNAPSLFDDADSCFYTNSEFREFDALPESADSKNEGHSLGQLALVRASPPCCLHERNAFSLINLVTAPFLNQRDRPMQLDSNQIRSIESLSLIHI